MALFALAVYFRWRRIRADSTAAELKAAALERQLAELRQASSRQMAVLEALQQAQLDPVLIVSGERVVVSLNPAARALFGAQSAVGQTLILLTR